MATGKRLPVRDGLRAGTWLEDGRLVAELFAAETGKPLLCLVRADGTMERELPLTIDWGRGSGSFADDLFRIPGDRDSILYGQHAGGSSEGAAHSFHRVNPKTGDAVWLADGLNVAWAPDHRSFCTGDGRDLADFSDDRSVWVSPLYIVSLKDGSRRTIVSGLVSVGDFDWRPQAPANKAAPKE